MKYYDNTRISDYKTCPRKFLLRHMFDLVPDGTPLALTFGLCWHDAMDVVWAMCNEGSHSDEKILGSAMLRWKATWEGRGMEYDLSLDKQDKYAPRTPMIAAEMLIQYISERRRFIEDCELISVEQPFAVKLYEDDTPIRYIGRFDKVVRHPQNGLLLIEHKTSSMYSKASGLRPDYVTSWSPNSQIDGYLHAAHMIFGDVKGIWIDAALVHKTVHNVFRFIPIDRQFAQLDQWLHETRDWIRRIENERAGAGNAEIHGPDQTYKGYPKNTGNCSMYAGCAYRDLCKFHATPDSILGNHSGYKVEHWEPFEILNVDQLGLPPENQDEIS